MAYQNKKQRNSTEEGYPSQGLKEVNPYAMAAFGISLKPNIVTFSRTPTEKPSEEEALELAIAEADYQRLRAKRRMASFR